MIFIYFSPRYRIASAEWNSRLIQCIYIYLPAVQSYLIRCVDLCHVEQHKHHTCTLNTWLECLWHLAICQVLQYKPGSCFVSHLKDSVTQGHIYAHKQKNSHTNYLYFCASCSFHCTILNPKVLQIIILEHFAFYPSQKQKSIKKPCRYNIPVFLILTLTLTWGIKTVVQRGWRL